MCTRDAKYIGKGMLAMELAGERERSERMFMDAMRENMHVHGMVGQGRMHM